jgi:hypothetical protein
MYNVFINSKGDNMSEFMTGQEDSKETETAQIQDAIKGLEKELEYLDTIEEGAESDEEYEFESGQADDESISIRQGEIRIRIAELKSKLEKLAK